MTIRLPRPTALVVGGGGCLGAAHVGVGTALEEHGFVPDLVVGTSVGALNGAIVAAHLATDLVTGSEVAMGDGDLASALLASAAVPGVLPPVEREGRVLVDGGVIAYVPVLAALRCGAASIVALSSGPESWPLRPTPPRRRATSVAARAGLFLLHHQIERDLQQVASRIPTVVVPTGIEDWPSPSDFSQGDRLIRTARDAALRFLDESPVHAAPGLYRTPGYRPDEALTSAAGTAGERPDRSAGARSAS